MFKPVLVCLLALLGGAALADGVPLITPAPALKANDPAQQLPERKMPDFVKMHPIALNKAAFGANVLTVVIDGKEHRFVGAMMQAQPIPKWVTSHQVIYESWGGREPGTSGLLSLTRNTETGTVGVTIELPPSRVFHLATPRNGAAVLVESDANVRFPTLHPSASGVPQ